MKQFKRAKAILLPHNDINTKITKYLPNTISLNNDISAPHTNQHLYIILNDDIKDGKYAVDLQNNKIVTFTDIYRIGRNAKRFKKIIATTDTSLHIPFVTPGNEELDIYEYNILPEPSQQFIKKYIECYNKGEIITNILVEYEMRHTGWTIDQSEYTYDEFLKVNPKNNTITIKSIKDSWNREEVYILLYNIWDDSIGMNKPIDEEFNKWIEQNL